jgi:hypothetical protein
MQAVRSIIFGTVLLCASGGSVAQQVTVTAKKPADVVLITSDAVAAVLTPCQGIVETNNTYDLVDVIFRKAITGAIVSELLRTTDSVVLVQTITFPAGGAVSASGQQVTYTVGSAP